MESAVSFTPLGQGGLFAGQLFFHGVSLQWSPLCGADNNRYIWWRCGKNGFIFHLGGWWLYQISDNNCDMMPSYYDGDAARLDSFSHQKCDGLVCQVTHKSGKTSAMVKKAMMMPSLVVVVMMKRLFFCLQIQDILYQFWLIMWGEKVFQGLNIHRERIHLATLKPLPFHRTLNSFIAHLWEGRRPQCAFL